MKRLLRAGPILATAALILAGVAGAAGGDVLVTVGSPTAPFSQNKQNEPAVAVNPIAPNIVAVAAGNFDWPKFVALVDKACGGWPTGELPAGALRMSSTNQFRTTSATRSTSTSVSSRSMPADTSDVSRISARSGAEDSVSR